jgi:hypothetical protein
MAGLKPVETLRLPAQLAAAVQRIEASRALAHETKPIEVREAQPFETWRRNNKNENDVLKNVSEIPLWTFPSIATKKIEYGSPILFTCHEKVGYCIRRVGTTLASNTTGAAVISTGSVGANAGASGTARSGVLSVPAVETSASGRATV